MRRPELVIAFIVIIVMEFRSSYGNPYPELNKRDSYTVHIEIFGEARCTDTTNCSCHHGLRECEKQALQACVISLIPETDEHLEIVGCIQGGDEFDDSVKKCLANKQPSLRVPTDRFVRCAKSDAGRSLIEHHGSIQRVIAPEVRWVSILSKKVF
ncbi:unnamed protein product [Angiostrongylus costaricensis]|uniref:Gamma interferon inducible lysosomal thiol reductase GILT n=1 Tax=Angiostrongylus costaricensis TaxID=334426 RepID=A0A0R3PAH0_ANGCS|nr:unnamed protein product [Angiostrongylus costaricensis]